jgi:hypothetical protein
MKAETGALRMEIFASMDDAFNKQAATGGGGELDEVKRMLTETNPILLATTLIVSLLHSLYVSFLSDLWWGLRGEASLVSIRLCSVYDQL